MLDPKVKPEIVEIEVDEIEEEDMESQGDS